MGECFDGQAGDKDLSSVTCAKLIHQAGLNRCINMYTGAHN